MTKKYKICRKTGRIQALRDFGDIKKGHLGGYIASENNLSHLGNAWVYGNARVSDDARVSGNAHVFDNARVSDNARVYGDALVSGNARVYGIAHVYGDAHVSGNADVYSDAHVFDNARVSDNARVYGDALVSGNVYGNAILDAANQYMELVGSSYKIRLYKNVVSVGCEQHTLDYWLEHYEKIGRDNDFTPTEIEEYGVLLQAVCLIKHSRDTD